jgi:hypothetical protein
MNPGISSGTAALHADNNYSPQQYDPFPVKIVMDLAQVVQHVTEELVPENNFLLIQTGFCTRS